MTSPIPEFFVDPTLEDEPVEYLSFDFSSNKWSTTEGSARLQESAFSKGHMRAAYCMEKVTPTSEWGHRFVAKMALNASERYQLEGYRTDVEMQYLAMALAKEYNERKPPKTVTFNAAGIVICTSRQVTTDTGETASLILATEPYIPGWYEKYNNNNGWVSPDNRNTPQAFSHFTYVRSQGSFLVCDIQGVGDCYTDPQVHSRDGQGYGAGNCGRSGMIQFFKSHRCNAICVHMNLRLHNPRPDMLVGTQPAHRLVIHLSQKRRVHGGGAAAAPVVVDTPQDAGGGESPRAQQPAAGDLPDDPFDLTFLGINAAQLDTLKRAFQENINDQGAFGWRELVVTAASLRVCVHPDDAKRAMKGRPTMKLWQFVWFWRGIDYD